MPGPNLSILLSSCVSSWPGILFLACKLVWYFVCLFFVVAFFFGNREWLRGEAGGIDLPCLLHLGLPDPVGSWLLKLTPSIILTSPPHPSVNLVLFFAQVSWVWQWLCRLSLVQLFNGNLFYALLSL